MQRVILIVMDGVGIGAAPDAADYGDSGSATLQNTASLVGGLELPVLAALGLGRSAEIAGLRSRASRPLGHVLGSYGVGERYLLKDTTTGHFELAGLKLDAPFPVFP